LIAILLIGLGFFGCELQAFSGKKPSVRPEFDREIRVHLGAYDTAAVNSSGEIIVECYREGRRAEIFYTSSVIGVFRYRKGLAVRDQNGTLAMGLSLAIFRPRFPNVFLDFGGKRYRGGIECDLDYGEASVDKKVRVFNLIDVELYLRGVLPGEIGDRTPDEFEAAKAQAIASRTYAIWRLSTQATDRHLKSSIEDQLYLGATAEIPLLNEAVEQTSGMIMTYDKKPIAAYYHAICGGSTSPIQKIWGGKRIPYLIGALDGDYCQWARVFFWNEKYKVKDLQESLSKYFGAKGQIPKKGFGRIVLLKFEKDPSLGRMARLEVRTTTGEFVVESDQIRWALSRPSVPGAKLPSTRFNERVIKSKGQIEALELSGAGNGHGVGMCQCGAIGRARAGASCDEILQHYYEGIQIDKIY